MQLHFDTLPQGLLVTLIGMLVVFLGLIVLIALISLINRISGGIGRKKAEQTAVAAEPYAQPAAAPVGDELLAVLAAAIAAQDEELVAVIAAAVAMMDGTNFRVRRVRRISNAPAWNKAGREEQIYSRY